MEPTGVNSLPVELLNEIFLWILVGYWQRDWRRQWRAKCRIMAVSRLWRAVLYSMSPYWAAVSIRRRSSNAYTEFAMERAFHGDISIWMDYSAVGLQCPSMTDFVAMLDRHLKPVFDRVTKLQVGGAAAEDWPQLAAALHRYHGTALESAFVTFTGAGAVGEQDFAVFGGMPNLRQLVCHSMPPSVGRGTWAGLTYLDIAQRATDNCLSWDALRHALGATVMLEKLKLENVVCDGLEIGAGNVVLPRLATLIILCCSEESLQIFAHIDTPALQNVCCEIHSREAVHALPELAMTGLAGASRWDVGIIDMSSGDVWALLGGMPGVVELDLRRSTLRTFEALETGLYDREGELPLLQELKLVGTCSADEAQTMLVGMRVASRRDIVGLEMYPSRRHRGVYVRWTLASGDEDA